MKDISGVLNIYKEKGFTSHDVVNLVRKKFNRIKTGHTGTLDPNATGVLPICLGKATKLSEYIASDIKEYKAIVTLGKTTDTQDIYGKILSESDLFVSKEQIKEVVYSFLGEIYQIPPMYSAIKVNGKKLYELARNGIDIERKSRKIKIYSINLDYFLDDKNFQITVLCSKGTYIRTFCHDIGQKLGCGACMRDLLRTKSGNFYIQDSIKLNQLDEFIKNNSIENLIIPMEVALKEFKKVYISQNAYKYLYNGNKLSFNYISNLHNLTFGEKVIVFDQNQKLIGIYQVFENYIKPLTMLL